MGGLEMKRITILLAAAALVLTVSVPQVLASGGSGTRIVLKAAKAFPAAKGSAKFKVAAEERELQVEVEHIRRLAGKRIVIFVGGKKLASAKVNRFGAAEIIRNSERGQFVPAVLTGTSVKVRTARGALIVRGSF
jgi:predicted PilT family ATPase